MIRMLTIASILAAGAALGACGHSSTSMSSNDGYGRDQPVRYDATGNRVYDSSVRQHYGTGSADSDRGGYPGNVYDNDSAASTSTEWKSRNDREMNGREWHANDPNSGKMNDRNMRDGQGQRSDDMNNRNMRDGQGQRPDDTNARSMHDGQGQRSDNNRSNWSDRSSNDHDMVMVTESELPNAARTGLSREAGGASLSETGRGMWNGKQCYCAKVTKNGHPYKVMTDSDGVLIMMHRLD